MTKKKRKQPAQRPAKDILQYLLTEPIMREKTPDLVAKAEEMVAGVLPAETAGGYRAPKVRSDEYQQLVKKTGKVVDRAYQEIQKELREKSIERDELKRRIEELKAQSIELEQQLAERQQEYGEG